MEFTEVMPLAQSKTIKHHRRQRTTFAQREYYLSMWRDSHLTQRSFCEHHQLHRSTFANWVRQSKEESHSINDAKATNLEGTAIVNPSPSPDSTICMEWHYPNKMMLRFTGRIDATMIITLIQGASQCIFN